MQFSLPQKWLTIAAAIIGVFLLLLGGVFYWQQRQINQLAAQVRLASALVPDSAISAPSPGDVTPTSSVSGITITQLDYQIIDLSNRVAQLEKKNGVQRPTVAAQPGVKEYLIYMGDGQTNNRDWTPITSAVVTINPSNYGQIKAVYFEAALSIIGGEAHAVLQNQTTGQVLYQTEIFNNESASQWETSVPFSLMAGNNTYVVQLKSTSGEMAILNGSRLRIELQ